ncbi:mRNA capping enzyme, catalytic domain-containing protein, partial [Dimargaris cristalligena]
LRGRVKSLLKVNHDRFPGSQPISFDRSAFQLLENEDYFVSEKADGVRYIMLIAHEDRKSTVFMVDRLNNYHYIKEMQMHLQFHDPKSKNQHQTRRETLIDGEMVVERSGNQVRRRFLAFDIMVNSSIIVTHRSYSTRLGMLHQDIIKPYLETLKRDPAIAKRQPFTMEIKKVERSYGIKLVFSEMANLKHKSDGLIFTPVKQEYIPGTCAKLLKWKPPDANTADFKIQVTYSKDRKPFYKLLVAANGVHKYFTHLQLEPDVYAQWRAHPPDNRIAEFRFDPDWKVTVVEEGYAPITQQGGWRFQRFRNDKNTANDEAVVKQIIQCIRQGVTRQEFESHLDKIRAHWKAR